MPEIKNFPNNQDEYRGAEAVMRWLYGRTSGVFGAAGNAAVSAFQTPRMAVQVSDGTGWMADRNGLGCVWWIDNNASGGSPLALAIDAADAVYNRIDRVIVEWNTPNYTDLPVVRILKGTFATKAVAPTLTNDSTTRQISLAKISIKAGATEISAADITDERLDEAVCGLVTDRVNVDTKTINAQVMALINELRGKLTDVESGSFYTTEVSATLTAAGWVGSGPYTQSVTVAALTDGRRCMVYPAYGDDADANLAMREACGCVSYSKREGQNVVFTCLEDKPEVDIDVIVEVYV